MAKHFENEAEKVTLVKRTRLFIQIILVVIIVVLGYLAYSLFLK